MKEIGGFFGLEQLKDGEYYKGLIHVNNGRSALLYILRAKNIRKVYLPQYLCYVVEDACLKHGYEVEHYHVDADFIPVFDKSLAEDECLYIVNYFGQLTDEKIMFLSRRFGRIVIDNAQAFFQRPLDGIDTVYTCRKFFGVPDGGYASTEESLTGGLSVDISRERMAHILGRYEGLASDYYEDFKRADVAFDDEPLKRMSKLTRNILGAIDYEGVRRIRNENYAYLLKELGNHNKLKLTVPDGPYAYPLYMDGGIEVRKALAKEKIYIPTLWPNVLDKSPKNSLAYDYAANILPLPCDQRYGPRDMARLVAEIRKYL